MTIPRLKKIYDPECTLCPLHANVKHVCVPSSGSVLKYRGLIVGEAPGRNEDEMNIPFIGRAGWLLERELKRVFKDSNIRASLPVTNAVKCRPTIAGGAYNLTPTQAAIDVCVDAYLTREIEAVDAHVLLAVGNVAASALLGVTGVKMLRDAWHALDADVERWVRVTYHPAYILRLGLESQEAREFRSDIEAFAEKCRSGRR